MRINTISRPLQTIIAVVVGALPFPASACLLAEKGSVESMVADADSIVIARATARQFDVVAACGAPLYEELPVDSSIHSIEKTEPSWLEALRCALSYERFAFLQMVVTEVLKGDRFDGGQTLQVFYDPSLRLRPRTDAAVPYEHRRPGGKGCFVLSYRAGYSYLLFLRGGLLYTFPQLPSNEEVLGEDAWVTWVRAQVALAQ